MTPSKAKLRKDTKQHSIAMPWPKMFAPIPMAGLLRLSPCVHRDRVWQLAKLAAPYAPRKQELLMTAQLPTDELSTLLMELLSAILSGRPAAAMREARPCSRRTGILSVDGLVVQCRDPAPDLGRRAQCK
ncbi:unnamed protein product [Cercospora beticola]|nr:unnamed protein product [Cercospora beticola]